MKILLENQRICPKCNIIIDYKNKYVARFNEKRRGKCRLCYGKERSNKMKGKICITVSPEGRERTRQALLNRIRSKEELDKCRETIKLAQKARTGGKNNYQLWIDKYGIDEANKRDSLARKKLSLASSGKNNPMFNKPAPHGSGNGWKCRYKNIYFRSLRELFFYLEYIDNKNIQWESGEKAKFSIPYISPMGINRNYFPDFIIGNNIYECKPKKLWNTPLVKAKVDAANKYCNDNGYNYFLIDIEIDSDKIKYLINSGLITWDEERYKNKFLKYFGLVV